MDGDGRADVVGTTWVGVAVFRSRADGTFADGWWVPTPLTNFTSIGSEAVAPRTLLRDLLGEPRRLEAVIFGTDVTVLRFPAAISRP